MTQHVEILSSEVARPGPPTLPPPREAVGTTGSPTWGWALVEIRSDGTWGEPQVVPAPGAVRPPVLAALTPASSSITELSELLKVHLRATDVGRTGHREIAAVLSRGATAPTAGARSAYLGPLAHVEALQGELRRAEHHADQAEAAALDGADAAGMRHALIARAWVALERADFDAARRHADSVDDDASGPDAWLATSRLLLEAKLHIATGMPEAATRLLAARGGSPADHTDWLSQLLTTTRAESLVASGEPQRAMRLITPLPQHAVVEAMVVAALARRTLGDLRGALAVLSRAVADLDHAPLALQVEAWMLEARMAEEQGRHDRARLLTDRALRSAATEGMRRAVLRDWSWARRFVERDADLMRAHRDFLDTCIAPGGPRWQSAPERTAPAVGARSAGSSPLTERESQVLDLLAQMYSTEEIAATLYVSPNTVKTHLKGIFGKLGVNRRVDAVRQGRVLGLC